MPKISWPGLTLALIALQISAPPASAQVGAQTLERLAGQTEQDLRSIYGDAFLEAKAADFDQDGDPEYVVMHGDSCSYILEDMDAGISISVCPWTIVDRIGGQFQEVVSVPAWRYNFTHNQDGQIIGVDFDGRRWSGETGHVLPQVAGFSWMDLDAIPDEFREVLGAVSVAQEDWRYGIAGSGGDRIVVAMEPVDATRRWVLHAAGDTAAEGVASGEVALMASPIGYMHLVDTMGGEILTTLTWPRPETFWREAWANPAEIPGLVALVPERINAPDSDPNGLWSQAEIDQSRDMGFARWYLSSAHLDMIELSGAPARVTFSMLNTTCSNTGCEIRGKIEGDGFEDTTRLLFNGEPFANGCFHDPFHMRYAPETNRLFLCGQDWDVAPEGGWPQPEVEIVIGDEMTIFTPGILISPGESSKAGAEDTCGLAEWSWMIGQPVDRAIEDRDGPVRILEPAGMATMDYVPDRMTVLVDEDGVVLDMRCG